MSFILQGLTQIPPTTRGLSNKFISHQPILSFILYSIQFVTYLFYNFWHILNKSSQSQNKLFRAKTISYTCFFWNFVLTGHVDTQFKFFESQTLQDTQRSSCSTFCQRRSLFTEKLRNDHLASALTASHEKKSTCQGSLLHCQIVMFIRCLVFHILS